MKIRAAWSRTIQVRPYESEKMELGVEGEYPVPGEEGGKVVAGKKAREAALTIERDLAAQLAALGDSLVAERIKVRKAMPEPTSKLKEPDDPF